MTHNDDDLADCENAARRRVTQISDLFAEMRALMVRWLEEAGPVADANNKQMMSKIGELQTAHLAVIRAEEAFHDKYGNGALADGLDYDAARDEIGGALDRLRAALETGYLSEGSDDVPD